jgi:hypothetical protein
MSDQPIIRSLEEHLDVISHLREERKGLVDFVTTQNQPIMVPIQAIRESAGRSLEVSLHLNFLPS